MEICVHITDNLFLSYFCFLNYSLDPLPHLGSWSFGVRVGKCSDGDLQPSLVNAICYAACLSLSKCQSGKVHNWSLCCYKSLSQMKKAIIHCSQDRIIECFRLENWVQPLIQHCQWNNVQSKPPMVQLKAIFSCIINCYLREDNDPHLSVASFR